MLLASALWRRARPVRQDLEAWGSGGPVRNKVPRRTRVIGSRSRKGAGSDATREAGQRMGSDQSQLLSTSVFCHLALRELLMPV